MNEKYTVQFHPLNGEKAEIGTVRHRDPPCESRSGYDNKGEPYSSLTSLSVNLHTAGYFTTASTATLDYKTYAKQNTYLVARLHYNGIPQRVNQLRIIHHKLKDIFIFPLSAIHYTKLRLLHPSRVPIICMSSCKAPIIFFIPRPNCEIQNWLLLFCMKGPTEDAVFCNI